MQEEESNVERKEKGESLPGRESSAEYMASQTGVVEEELKQRLKQKRIQRLWQAR